MRNFFTFKNIKQSTAFADICKVPIKLPTPQVVKFSKTAAHKITPLEQSMSFHEIFFSGR